MITVRFRIGTCLHVTILTFRLQVLRCINFLCRLNLMEMDGRVKFRKEGVEVQPVSVRVIFLLL
jgi:hypothetical protein